MSPKKVCPDCGEGPVPSKAEGVSRRDFMKTAAAAVPAAALAKPLVWASTWREEKPEALVKKFHESLKPDQKEKICFGWDDPRRQKVSNNWEIVPQQIGKFYTGDQQQLLKDIFRGLISEDGAARFAKSMKDDYGGIESYHVAMFGDPATDKWEWVLTGRHVTIRCDGDTQENTAFGGPIFYGHAAEGFNEKPDHPGNVFWKQALLANKLFAALSGKQQETALAEKSPADDEKSIRIKKSGPWNGICVGELSKDQKGLVEDTMKDLLAPYRASDVEEALAFIKEGGGLDKIHIAFYRDGDLGNDRVWDRWKLEGPTMSWYFSGSPHVHTWVNVGRA
ncbi:MAG: DUF3500 domain-containing protein [Planctomycetes bacterium]|nr:DUF3500 domain-containing protein [Planctomycetota bacterium]